jgi:hypothetical protein
MSQQIDAVVHGRDTEFCLLFATRRVTTLYPSVSDPLIPHQLLTRNRLESCGLNAFVPRWCHPNDGLLKVVLGRTVILYRTTTCKRLITVDKV